MTIAILPAVAVKNNSQYSQRSFLTNVRNITIYVDIQNTEGPWEGTLEHPYRWIWQGIEAAEDGDTVFVFHGLYSDGLGERPININKSINLIGENTDSTFVHMYYWYDYVINITAGHVNVSGFTFRIDDKTPMDSIMFLNGSHCIISENNFWGKHIEFSEMALVIITDTHNNIIIKNQIFKPMVNIKKDTTGLLLIRSYNTTIKENNISNYYSGIFLLNSTNSSLIDNDVNSNQAIVLETSSGNLISGNILHNYGIGLILWKSMDNQITSNRFTDKHIRSKMAYFIDCNNYWNFNYWRRGRVLPKIIFGAKTVNGQPLLAIQIDWHPAKK